MPADSSTETGQNPPWMEELLFRYQEGLFTLPGSFSLSLSRSGGTKALIALFLLHLTAIIWKHKGEVKRLERKCIAQKPGPCLKWPSAQLALLSRTHPEVWQGRSHRETQSKGQHFGNKISKNQHVSRLGTVSSRSQIHRTHWAIKLNKQAIKLRVSMERLSS